MNTMQGATKMKQNGKEGVNGQYVDYKEHGREVQHTQRVQDCHCVQYCRRIQNNSQDAQDEQVVQQTNNVPFSAACLKSFLTLAGPLPTNTSTKSEAEQA